MSDFSPAHAIVSYTVLVIFDAKEGAVSQGTPNRSAPPSGSAPTIAAREQRSASYRALWAAVVLQAQEDVRHEPIDSVNYAQAVHFFIGAGEWADARARISDHLDMHRDDLENCGRRCINERRLAAGLDPLPRRLRPLPEHTAPRPPAPKPLPARVPQALSSPPPAAHQEPVRAKKPYLRRPKVPPTHNPFFPNGIPGQDGAIYQSAA
jgi:hypothetical protein